MWIFAASTGRMPVEMRKVVSCLFREVPANVLQSGSCHPAAIATSPEICNLENPPGHRNLKIYFF
jgi:hypothetical protein